MTDETVDAPYIDDLSVREVYAEVVQVLFGVPGTMRIELCVNRWNQTKPLRVDRIVPVARVFTCIITLYLAESICEIAANIR